MDENIVLVEKRRSCASIYIMLVFFSRFLSSRLSTMDRISEILERYIHYRSWLEIPTTNMDIKMRYTSLERVHRPSFIPTRMLKRIPDRRLHGSSIFVFKRQKPAALSPSQLIKTFFFKTTPDWLQGRLLRDRAERRGKGEEECCGGTGRWMRVRDIWRSLGSVTRKPPNGTMVKRKLSTLAEAILLDYSGGSSQLAAGSLTPGNKVWGLPK